MGVPTYAHTQMRDAWQAELTCTERWHRRFAMAIGATTGGLS
jgi:hypothetical protein